MAAGCGRGLFRNLTLTSRKNLFKTAAAGMLAVDGPPRTQQHDPPQLPSRQATSTSSTVRRQEAGLTEAGVHRWVFLGAPGVGKGTYASRLGRQLGIPHISMGDVVRDELQRGSRLGTEMSELARTGRLLPDSIVLELLRRRLQAGADRGECGFILDGFPRTTAQAEALDSMTPVDLAVNLILREDILRAKLLGRRICSGCGGNYNVADIHIAASDSTPAIIMPALPPPMDCVSKLTIRPDDTEEVVQRRLEVYYKESKPVEEFYRRRGQLLDFEITGGIPETWPRLLHALGLDSEDAECEAQQVA